MNLLRCTQLKKCVALTEDIAPFHVFKLKNKTSYEVFRYEERH